MHPLRFSPHLAEFAVGGDLLFLVVQLFWIITTDLKSTSSFLQKIPNGPYSLNKPLGWKRQQLLYSWVWTLVCFSSNMKGFIFLKVHWLGWHERPFLLFHGRRPGHSEMVIFHTFPSPLPNATQNLLFNGKFNVFREQLNLRADCC